MRKGLDVSLEKQKDGEEEGDLKVVYSGSEFARRVLFRRCCCGIYYNESLKTSCPNCGQSPTIITTDHPDADVVYRVLKDVFLPLKRGSPCHNYSRPSEKRKREFVYE